MIDIRGLSKDYALGNTVVHALRGIDFAVSSGEFICVVGPSGSGKTTLLNVIGCIDSPSAGSVRIDGVEVTALSDRQITDIRLHKIGFIFQTFNLIPVLNVLENVEFPLLLMKRHSAREIRRRSAELAEKVGLKEFVRHRPAELSGGQRQRVAIARALVTNPGIILADEPTANLDSATGASILEVMVEMNRAEHTTFVFSTHDANVLTYAQRVVKIRDGRIVEGEGR